MKKQRKWCKALEDAGQREVRRGDTLVGSIYERIHRKCKNKAVFGFDHCSTHLKKLSQGAPNCHCCGKLDKF